MNLSLERYKVCYVESLISRTYTMKNHSTMYWTSKVIQGRFQDIQLMSVHVYNAFLWKLIVLKIPLYLVKIHSVSRQSSFINFIQLICLLSSNFGIIDEHHDADIQCFSLSLLISLRICVNKDLSNIFFFHLEIFLQQTTLDNLSNLFCCIRWTLKSQM